MKNLPTIAREGLWVGAGTFTNMLSGLLIVRLLTTAMDPTKYGALALALTGATLVNQIALGGLSNSIGRYFVAADSPEETYVICKASRQLFCWIGLATGSCAAIAIFIGHVFTSAICAITIIAAAVFAISSGFSLVVNTVLNAVRQRRRAAQYLAFEAGIKLILIWIIVTSGSVEPAGVLITYSLAAVIPAGFAYRKISLATAGDESDSQSVAANRKRLIAYALPFAMWGPFTWLQQSSDRWSLASFGSLSDVGLYSVLFQLGYAPISVLTGVLVTTVGPMLYSKAKMENGNGGRSAVSQTTLIVSKYVMLLVIIVSVLMMFLHEIIFSLFSGPLYASVSYLMPFAFLAGGVFAVAQMFALQLMAEMRPAAMLTAKITTALVGTGLNMTGALWFGVAGVVFAQIIFSVVLLRWMWVLAKKSDLTSVSRCNSSS